MIKSEKGKVILKGDAKGVLAEFGCIYSSSYRYIRNSQRRQ